MATINDRTTGLLKMKKVKNRNAEEVPKATIALRKPLNPWLQPITGDNGKGFALHQEMASDFTITIDFYFARPYHSWERGANENLNGLIRRYIPKKANFDDYTDEEIQSIEQQINLRPRKRFNFVVPIEMFNPKVAFVT
jgi:IS30 family transposase